MIGIATLLFLLSAWYALCWIFRRDMPKSKWFLRIAASAGVLSIIAMEAGWVVTEVGRQPWIVFGHMKVEDAATTNSGVWVTFIVILLLYAAVAVATIMVLRTMSRRFRETGEAELVPGPYGPRDRTALDEDTEEVRS
jgi:cytochrome d ubiquinol oxidase subunit I